jgi:SNF family Na+-dependent transporter
VKDVGRWFSKVPLAAVSSLFALSQMNVKNVSTVFYSSRSELTIMPSLFCVGSIRVPVSGDVFSIPRKT